MSYRQRTKLLLESVSEFNSDLPDILRQLEEIRQLCLSGMESEKVSNKAVDGFVRVTEVYPAVALQAALGKLAVLKEMDRIACQNIPDPVVTINFVRQTLEGASSNGDD